MSPFASTAVGTGSRCVRMQPGAFNLLCLKCGHGLKPGNAAVGSRDHLTLPVALSFHGFFFPLVPLRGNISPISLQSLVWEHIKTSGIISAIIIMIFHSAYPCHACQIVTAPCFQEHFFFVAS